MLPFKNIFLFFLSFCCYLFIMEYDYCDMSGIGFFFVYVFLLQFSIYSYFQVPFIFTSKLKNLRRQRIVPLFFLLIGYLYLIIVALFPTIKIKTETIKGQMLIGLFFVIISSIIDSKITKSTKNSQPSGKRTELENKLKEGNGDHELTEPVSGK